MLGSQSGNENKKNSQLMFQYAFKLIFYQQFKGLTFHCLLPDNFESESGNHSAL